MSEKKALTHDEKIEKLFEVVSQKKAEIAKAEKPNYATNCTFGFTEESAANRINLQTTTDLKTFVTILAFLNERETSFELAKEELGLMELKFTWMGFTVEDWRKDIQTRINKIQINKKKEELESLNSRLNALISPEMRATMELEAIEKELL